MFKKRPNHLEQKRFTAPPASRSRLTTYSSEDSTTEPFFILTRPWGVTGCIVAIFQNLKGKGGMNSEDAKKSQRR